MQFLGKNQSDFRQSLLGLTEKKKILWRLNLKLPLKMNKGQAFDTDVMLLGIMCYDWLYVTCSIMLGMAC